MTSVLPPKLTPIQFQKTVLKWYKAHGRKDLPWQQNITPYRVWVSEIMLQQTQVTTVIPYFNHFMAVFPDVKTLAAADTDTVMHLWTGLGYYSRARNLHKTAQIILADHDGHFPKTLAALSALPGIGRSTAAAIISIAFNHSAAILDGNVKRVLSRYAGITGWPGDKAIERQLWQLADDHTPEQNCREYTQVMMDLGAMICTRSKPKCDHCPLQNNCLAYRSGNPTHFPGKKIKKSIPTRSGYLLLLQQADGRILLEKRPPSGIWGGLWCLPEYKEDETKLADWCHAEYGLNIKKITKLSPFRHTFSHFHYDITPIQLLVVTAKNKVREQPLQLWYDVNQPAKVGLAQPVKKLLMQN